MTTLRRGLLGLALTAGVAAGALPAAAEGLDKGGPYVPAAWQGLYGGVHLGSADVGRDDGLVGGIQIGHNRRSGSVVYGLEADISFADMDDADLMGTARGRLGYLILPNLLIYGTAGVGFVDFRDDTETDFVYGIGGEYQLTPRTTVRLEYLGFSDIEVDVVRVGLNVKLGGDLGW